jgi:hypothetical protein
MLFGKESNGDHADEKRRFELRLVFGDLTVAKCGDKFRRFPGD